MEHEWVSFIVYRWQDWQADVAPQTLWYCNKKAVIFLRKIPQLAWRRKFSNSNSFGRLYKSNWRLWHERVENFPQSHERRRLMHVIFSFSVLNAQDLRNGSCFVCYLYVRSVLGNRCDITNPCSSSFSAEGGIRNFSLNFSISTLHRFSFWNFPCSRREFHA